MTMRFSPDGRTLATTSGDADGLTLWDVTDPVHPAERGRLPRVRSEPGPKYDVMTFTPDSALLAANDDGLVSLWNLIDPAHPTLTSTVDTTATEGGRPPSLRRSFWIARRCRPYCWPSIPPRSSGSRRGWFLLR